MPFVAVLAAAALASQATPAAAQGEGWGLSVGVTGSTLSGDFVTAAGDTKWGFFGGVFGERYLSDNLALNLAVNYSQRGGQGLTGPPSDPVRYDIALNYIELPLLAEILLPLGGTWDLMAYGGIGVAFNVSCKAGFAGGSRESCQDTALGKARTEWSAPVGGGFSYQVGNGDMVVFEARYSWGLSDAVENVDLRNRGWTFILRLARRLS
jgi:hypothetical protein